MIDERQRAAMQRMTMLRPEETRMAYEDQQNAAGEARVDADGKTYYDSAPRTEYPKMMFKKTDVEQKQEWADQLHAGSEEKYVTNRFDGLLCDTIVANTADEAEILTENGWDSSPRAAYGMETGLASITSAKDEEIARLRAELEQASAPRRGRPPKEQAEPVPVNVVGKEQKAY